MASLNSDFGKTYSLQDGIQIPSGADLKTDTYKIPGNYYCNTDTIAKTLKNCPLNSAFTLKVEFGTGTRYPKQIFKRNFSSDIVIRSWASDQDFWSDEVTYISDNDLAIIEIEDSNSGQNHYETIKNHWDLFPLDRPFISKIRDDNRFICIGYIYPENSNYGAVLYIAYNTSGIVKYANGTFSEVKL